MRVVVLGATGNVGTAVVEALREHSDVEHVVGVARRLPGTVSARRWRDVAGG